MGQKEKQSKLLPGIDGAPSPIGPPETAGWVTVEGLDIQSGEGTGAGVGWKGWTHKFKNIRRAIQPV